MRVGEPHPGEQSGDDDAGAKNHSLDARHSDCVIASQDASFGIMSYGNKIELHVFSGDVTFEPLQSFSFGDAPEKLKVLAGTSLKLSLSRDSAIAVQRGLANTN